MSSQNTAATTEQQPEQAVTVLLIAHKQNQFSAAASFLTRRGIPCTIKGNIKDGIAYIQKNKPSYVFLSWNLPNANIAKTYQLFTKTFKVDCVVFAEKGDGKTAAEIANSRLPQTMQAPVSGPGLYMRIQKLIKSKLEDDHDTPEARTAIGQKDGAQKDDRIVLKNSGKKSDDKDGFITLSSNKKDGDKPGIINFQKAKYSEDDIEIPTGNGSGDDNDISAYMNDLTDDDGSINAGSNDTNEYDVPSDGSENDLNGFDIPVDDESEEKSATSVAKKKKDYGSVKNLAKNTENKDQDLPQYEASKKKDSIVINPNESNENSLDPDYNITKENAVVIMDFSPKAESKITKTLLFEKTLQAINESTRHVYENYEKVAVISKAKIVNIHTPRFHGYLLWVVPMYYEFDRALFTTMKEKIQFLLKQEGEELWHFEDLNVDLEQIDFLSWCKEHAEFFIETADKSNQIICAYFPTEPSMPKLEEGSAKMTSIEVKDLKAQTKVKFNLFIHLPKNNKFLRYLKPGDTVTEQHTQKFEEHKVKNLHITKDDVESFKEYFASNRINEAIRKKKAS